jgi:hypothetical protein
MVASHMLKDESWQGIPMATMGKRVLLIFLPGALLCSGCSRMREGGTSARQPERLVRAAPDWGPQSEGLQCRLRPTKRLWQKGEPLTFKLDLRNQGSRLFAFDVREPVRPSSVAVDGRWYYQLRDETNLATIRPLAPQADLADLTLIVSPAMDLPLGPGLHTIQVALELEDLTVLSNPVGIEIASPPTSDTVRNR